MLYLQGLTVKCLARIGTNKHSLSKWTWQMTEINMVSFYNKNKLSNFFSYNPFNSKHHKIQFSGCSQIPLMQSQQGAKSKGARPA